MNELVKASVTACVMCGVPLAAWRPLSGVLCRSPVCAAQHHSLPPTAKCSVCTRPLTFAQLSRGHCDQSVCREETSRIRREQNAARRAELLAQVKKRRERAAAQLGLSREVQATYKAALIPLNTDRTSRLATRRRALHEAHLRSCLAEARRSAERSNAPPVRVDVGSSDRGTPAQRAETQLLLTACAACRGQCCREGGNHAFLSAESMLAYLQRFPTADDDTVIAHHMQHIGDQTMTHGCVYQGLRGCTLAPDLRADICHRFHCTGLMMMKGQYAAGEPIRAYLVHRRGERLTGGHFVEIATTADPAPPTNTALAD